MSTLSLTLSASPRETPTSYLSRLAARNLAPDMESFSQDVGLDLPALSTGDPASVAQLCRLARLPAASFARTTILKTSTMKYLVGREVLNTETLGRGEIRYCPHCLADGLESGPTWQVVFPLHWQYLQIRRCTAHGTLLQSHRPKTTRAAPFDSTAFLRRLSPEGKPTHSIDVKAADPLDHYLTARAYGDLAGLWCDQLDLPGFVKACEAFGTLMEYGRDQRASSLSAEARRDAMATGFDVLRRGPPAIRAALDTFNRETPKRGGNQPHPSNGEVQRLLGADGKLRADLDPLRDIVRDYFLDNYPYRPGTIILGQMIDRPRVLSIRTACRQIGMRDSLLKEILIRRGLAARDETGAFTLKTPLTRALVDELKAEKDNYLDQTQTAAALGCSFAMFKQLQNAGVLEPADGTGRWKREGFYRPDLDALPTQIGGQAPHMSKTPQNLCTIELATRKANCSVPDIVRLLLDGTLKAKARRSKALRLDTLLVDPGDILALRETTAPNGYSKTETRRRLFIDAATLNWLIDAGYIDLQRMRHSHTRVTRDYITAESLQRFESAYGTAEAIARKHGQSAKDIRRVVRGKGLSEINEGLALRKIYRKDEVIPHLNVSDSQQRTARKKAIKQSIQREVDSDDAGY
ncbi:TniQ family protein [Paracoccaceae bacterium GXU_MW_L88]